MKICIYGVGGVGGYFGGKIAHMLHTDDSLPHEVYFIARGDHLNEIQTHGLILNEDHHDPVVCIPTLATDDVTSLPAIDLFLICVKSYDLDHVIRSIVPKLHDSTVILPLLNGITIYDRIRAITQKGIVFPACVYVGTHIASPGIITQKGGEGKILFGPDPNYPDFSPASILHLFDTLHIHYEWNTDPKIAIWTKYLFIAGYGLVCAARSKTLGQVYEDPILKNDVSTIMHEIVSLAEAQAIFLPHNVIALSLRKATQFPYDTKTSFHRDIESKGHRNEMDIFGKAILELGQKYSCSTAKTEEYVTRLL